MRWFSIAKSKGVANRDPHRGLHVLGTTHQGRPDLGPPQSKSILTLWFQPTPSFFCLFERKHNI